MQVEVLYDKAKFDSAMKYMAEFRGIENPAGVFNELLRESYQKLKDGDNITSVVRDLGLLLYVTWLGENKEGIISLCVDIYHTPNYDDCRQFKALVNI